jgi:hypothetical protein
MVGERLRDQCGVLRFMADQDRAGHRLVLVELDDEGAEHGFGAELLVV